MKFRIDIDCTPQEARTFLGLPDVESVQKAMAEEIESRLRAALDRMDPERMFETWMPAVRGCEDLMKALVPKVDPSPRKGRSGS